MARAVFQNALARLKTQVQAVEVGVTFFEVIDHSQALQVVLEAAKFGHAGVQSVLPGMAKRGVAQVVRQGNGFDQVFVELQRARHGAAQLRHFQRMREARAKQVALVVQKDLGFVDQAPKRGAMHDAVAVALKLGTRGRRGLRKAPPARVRRVAGVGREHQAPVAQQASITARTRASGAPRTQARPGPSISTKRISPPSAFLSTRIRSR